VVTSYAYVDYFQPRVPFSVFGFITGNPLISVAIVFALVVARFPGLLTIDAESIEEAQKDANDMSDKVLLL
jgi:hypothetical protein